MKAALTLALVISAWLSFSPGAAAQLPSLTVGFEQRVQVEAIRSKRTRIEGGDFDDKADRITFNVKFTNTDPKTAFTGCKAEFYVLAQSILNRRAYQLLGVDKAAISLPPLGTQEMTTTEVVTRFDTTGARFGAKYDAWVLVVRDSTGKMVLKKTNSPAWLPVAEKLNKVAVSSFFDQTLAKANP